MYLAALSPGTAEFSMDNDWKGQKDETVTHEVCGNLSPTVTSYSYLVSFLWIAHKRRV
jgi:hypothetical protein